MTRKTRERASCASSSLRVPGFLSSFLPRTVMESPALRAMQCISWVSYMYINYAKEEAEHWRRTTEFLDARAPISAIASWMVLACHRNLKEYKKTPRKHLWRNRLARSAVNRKVVGSSPTRCEALFFFQTQYSEHGIALYWNHLTFLIKCRYFWRRRTYLIVEKTSRAVLREHTRTTKTTTSQQITKATLEWQVWIDDCTFAQLKWKADKVFIEVWERQKIKFDKLVGIKRNNRDKQDNHTTTPNREMKVVINLSEQRLNKTEEEILSLGMNYALTPRENGGLGQALRQSHSAGAETVKPQPLI